jgi:hypothetical protein
MDQTHLGYTAWNDPPKNSLNAIKLTEVPISDTSEMGVTVQNSELTWPGSTEIAKLPVFDIFNKQSRFFEIYNKGSKTFLYKIKSPKPWININSAFGTVQKNVRIYASIDWNKAPKGFLSDTIYVVGENIEVPIIINISNPTEPTLKNLNGFVESDGYVSIEAEHFSKNTDAGSNKWIKIEDYGHTLSGMRATSEANAEATKPNINAPCLEYNMYLFSKGNINLQTICGPVLNFIPNRAVRFAVAFDNEEPKIVTLVPEKYDAQNGNKDWEKSVSDNARFGNSKHTTIKEGYHTLKILMIDPGVVIQKIIVDLGGVKPSYLGPPESFFKFR